eukprot:1818575-Amphidinium_carterae.1
MSYVHPSSFRAMCWISRRGCQKRNWPVLTGADELALQRMPLIKQAVVTWLILTGTATNQLQRMSGCGMWVCKRVRARVRAVIADFVTQRQKTIRFRPVLGEAVVQCEADEGTMGIANQKESA